jgi:hypothetical protein
VTFQSPGQELIRELYVLKPRCKKGPCEIDVDIQSTDGRRLASSVFHAKDGTYVSTNKRVARVNCSAEGSTIERGARREIRTSVRLAGYRPSGTATIVPRITGQRTIVTEPVAGSKCRSGTVQYQAMGEPTALEAPRSTPTPTAATSRGTNSEPQSSTGWTAAAARTAQRYLASVERTYADTVVPNATQLIGYGCVPGLTDAECRARRAEAAIYRDRALAAVRRHVAFMSSNGASRCFRDAYTADRRIARQWQALLASTDYPTTQTGEGRARLQEYETQFSRTGAFLNKLQAYFRDCR